MAWADDPAVVEIRLSASTALECQSVLRGPSEVIIGDEFSRLRISPEALENLAKDADGGLDIHSWLLAQIAMQTTPAPVAEWLSTVFGALRGWPRKSKATFRKLRVVRQRRYALAEHLVAYEGRDPSLSGSERLRRARSHLKARETDGRLRRLQSVSLKALESDVAAPEFKKLLGILRDGKRLREESKTTVRVFLKSVT